MGRTLPATAARSRALAALVALAALARPGPAPAHEFQLDSYLDVRVAADRLEGRIIADVRDLAHELGMPASDSLLVRAYADRRLESLHRLLAARLSVLADGDTIRPRWVSYFAVAESQLLGFEWTAPLARPPAVVTVNGPLFTYDRWHRTYLNVLEAGEIRFQDVLSRSHTRALYYSGTRSGRLAVMKSYTLQGLHHIFAGPDHILFVVGLLLLGGGLMRLLKIVTAFTLAHTVTLGLATLRLVDPPSRVIEPAIALSIVLVGVETLIAIRRRRDWRAPIAFGFGLVHGFGFAGVLRDVGLPQNALGWSLAAFNVGVELGQACIVLAVAPALSVLNARHPAAAKRVITWSAASIIAAGVFWFVERVR